MAAGIWENPGVAVETNVYRCEPEGWAARGEVGEKGPSPWWGREGEVPVAPKIVGVIRGDTGGGCFFITSQARAHLIFCQVAALPMR